MELENASVEGAGSLILRIVIAERSPGIGITLQIQIGRIAGAVLVDGQLCKGTEIAVSIGILRLLKEVPCACGGGNGLVGIFRQGTGSVVLLENPIVVTTEPGEYQRNSKFWVTVLNYLATSYRIESKKKEGARYGQILFGS